MCIAQGRGKKEQEVMRSDIYECQATSINGVLKASSGAFGAPSYMAERCCRISVVKLCCVVAAVEVAESRVDHVEIYSIRDFAKRRIE